MTMQTPKLRALRVASLTPLQGAMPAARQSRFRGIPPTVHSASTRAEAAET